MPATRESELEAHFAAEVTKAMVVGMSGGLSDQGCVGELGKGCEAVNYLEQFANIARHVWFVLGQVSKPM